jgi:hypothetical protein
MEHPPLQGGIRWFPCHPAYTRQANQGIERAQTVVFRHGHQQVDRFTSQAQQEMPGIIQFQDARL